MSSDKRDTMAEPLRVLVVGKLYAPEEIIGPVAIVLEGTKIHAIWRVTDIAQAQQVCAEYILGKAIEVSDLSTWRAAPGYIELHKRGHGWVRESNTNMAHLYCQA